MPFVWLRATTMLASPLASTAPAVSIAPASNGAPVLRRSNSGQKISAMPTSPHAPPSATRRDIGVPRKMRASTMLTSGSAE